MELTPVVVIVIVGIAVLVGFALIRWGRRNEAAPPADRHVTPARTISMAARMGRDSDALVEWLLDHASKETGVPLANDPLARDRIVKAAEKAVEDLRSTGSAAVNLPFLAADEQGPKHLAVRFKRTSDSTFEVLG